MNNKQLIEEARDRYEKYHQMQTNYCVAACWGAIQMLPEMADALEQAEQDNRWISVEEALPTANDGKVFVYTKYGFSVCERTINNHWRGQHACWITHWRPLPEPPKGD